jgi:hypothetical protein
VAEKALESLSSPLPFGGEWIGAEFTAAPIGGTLDRIDQIRIRRPHRIIPVIKLFWLTGLNFTNKNNVLRISLFQAVTERIILFQRVILRSTSVSRFQVADLVTVTIFELSSFPLNTLYSSLVHVMLNMDRERQKKCITSLKQS